MTELETKMVLALADIAQWTGNRRIKDSVLAVVVEAARLSGEHVEEAPLPTIEPHLLEVGK